MQHSPPPARRRALWILGVSLASSIVAFEPGAPPASGARGASSGSGSARRASLFFGGSADAAAEGCEELLGAANVAVADAEKQKNPARARDALGLLERAARLCPDDPEIPFVAGLANWILADPDSIRAAASTIERLVTARALELNRPPSEGANDPRALFLRALVHRTFGSRPDAAIELLNRIRARAPGFRREAVLSVLFWSHIDYAILLSERSDAEGAVKQATLAEAVANSTGDVDRRDLARHRRAQVLAVGTRWSEAQDILEDLAKRYPKDAHVRFDLATAYAEQFRLDDAVSTWRETLRLLALPDVDPRLVELLSDAQMRLGVCLCQRGDTTEGKAGLLKYVESHANDGRGWHYLGRAAVQTDEPCKAVEHFERARALDPSCENTLRELVKLYSTSCPDPTKAKALEEILENDKAAREAEMKRRIRVRPDKSDGCR